MKILYSVFAVICAIGLTACSNEPSKSDIEKAMQETAERRSSMRLGPKVTPKVSVKDAKCEPVEEKEVYKCQVRAVLKIKEMGKEKEDNFPITLRKVDGKWYAS